MSSKIRRLMASSACLAACGCSVSEWDIPPWLRTHDPSLPLFAIAEREPISIETSTPAGMFRDAELVAPSTVDSYRFETYQETPSLDSTVIEDLHRAETMQPDLDISVPASLQDSFPSTRSYGLDAYLGPAGSPSALPGISDSAFDSPGIASPTGTSPDESHISDEELLRRAADLVNGLNAEGETAVQKSLAPAKPDDPFEAFRTPADDPFGLRPRPEPGPFDPSTTYFPMPDKSNE